jgi:hypothetical protein
MAVAAAKRLTDDTFTKAVLVFVGSKKMDGVRRTSETSHEFSRKSFYLASVVAKCRPLLNET